MIEPWIETFTGKKMYFLEPKPLMIDIDDIAHSLGLQCRFSGHTSKFYSVAEHSVRVSQLIKEMTNDPTVALQGLLHDATEAYLLDVPSPVKAYLGGYHEIEDNLARCIFSKYLLPYPFGTEVKEIDTVMLKNEARHLLPSKGAAWISQYPTGFEYFAAPFCLNPEEAAATFLAWFYHLAKERQQYEPSPSIA